MDMQWFNMLAYAPILSMMNFSLNHAGDSHRHSGEKEALGPQRCDNISRSLTLVLPLNARLTEMGLNR
ncbi:MAG: hypothetical protein CXT71_07505 [Methanobacteriota archaeon]|nr:MAG: hypothetical protein CXT71_07505 [Euryarchaeota archaeon]